jgi:hypothetical protein
VTLDFGPVRELNPTTGVPVDFESGKCGNPTNLEAYLGELMGSPSDPAVIDSGERAIHVLYVKSINPSSDGEVCRRPSTGASYGVILISETGAWSTLLHELGHFLAQTLLQYPNGHTNNMAGFHCTNWMWDGLLLDCPGIRVDISLGQVFRAWVDPYWKYNWLKHTGTLPLERSCDPVDNGYTVGICPMLALDVKGTEGGP